LVLLGGLVQAEISMAADSKPLPEMNSFLQNVRDHLHSNRFIQSNYTYIEKSISRQLDSGGKVKKTETRVYEVYPSIEEEFTYRKLIAKDDNLLSVEEIKKSDITQVFLQIGGKIIRDSIYCRHWQAIIPEISGKGEKCPVFFNIAVESPDG